jgi:hypothetical protein
MFFACKLLFLTIIISGTCWISIFSFGAWIKLKAKPPSAERDEYYEIGSRKIKHPAFK